MQVKTGLCSVSFRTHTPKEILFAMKKADLSVIEWGSDVHAPCDDPKALFALQTLQEEYGVSCSSYGTYFRLGVTPLSQLEDYIRGAAILHTRILRLWCGDKNSEEYTPEEKARLLECCHQAAATAQRHGVTLCMECHNRTYTNRKEGALELMQEVNSKHFQMYWQPNQYATDDENLAYASALAPYTRQLHVFCWKEKEKYPLKDGVAKWRKYRACFGDDVTFLLEFMPDGRLETLKGEADALRAICT